MSAHLPLGDLEGALVPAHLQQLHEALFVGGLARHLAHDVAHELDALGLALQGGKERAEMVRKCVAAAVGRRRGVPPCPRWDGLPPCGCARLCAPPRASTASVAAARLSEQRRAGCQGPGACIACMVRPAGWRCITLRRAAKDSGTPCPCRWSGCRGAGESGLGVRCMPRAAWRPPSRLTPLREAGLTAFSRLVTWWPLARPTAMPALAIVSFLSAWKEGRCSKRGAAGCA